ncbi:MAG TPA: hypothetical protein VJ873_10715 [bacterium]|nr:hypothetical protein [bacterium]
MEINTFCPSCENGIFLHEMPRAGTIPCKRCGNGREATGNGELDGQGALQKCGICGCAEFYRQKDFNTKLGLWITVLILGTALLFLLLNHLKTGFGILVVGALLDLILYFSLGDIVLCYNCRAIYRGMPISSKVEGFDLKIHDQYEFKKKK